MSEFQLPSRPNLEGNYNFKSRTPVFRIGSCYDYGVPRTISEFNVKKYAEKTSPGQNLFTPAGVRRTKLSYMGTDENGIHPVAPKVILTRSHKGGVGKTTFCGNLAAAFALSGYKTLAIDFDDQGSLTALLGYHPSFVEDEHFGSVLKEYREGRLTTAYLEKVSIPIMTDGMLDLIPSCLAMGDVDEIIRSVPVRERIIRAMMEKHAAFFNRYDVVLMDAPPSSQQFQASLVVATNVILIPVNVDTESKRAVDHQLALIASLREHGLPTPEHEILINGSSKRLSHTEGITRLLQETYPGKVYRESFGYSPAVERHPVDVLLDVGAKDTFVEANPRAEYSRQILHLADYLTQRYQITLGGLSGLLLKTN